jgi:hypothetical protein
MRSLISTRSWSVFFAALLTLALVIASTAAVDAKRPPKPPPTPSPAPTAPPSGGGSASVVIAPTGTLEPSGEYANVDVTATCPVGWTWSSGWLYVLHGNLGGSGSFGGSCTGTPQVAHARVVNGNRFTLGDWTATAYLNIVRNGQQVQVTSTRTIRLEPGVTARIADHGQLTGTSGGGVRLALAVACPIGASGTQSSVTVSQGSALGRAFFTPTCDRFSHTVVLSMTASQGVFDTGAAVGDAAVAVTWNGGTFSGADSRSITILESSTGDTTPPTTPAGLSANVFGDGETWLSWGASADNATPTGLIVYEVYLNGQFDQGIGGGYTQAILYAEMNRLNTIEVIAVDGAGNRSAPASITVDTRF